MSRPKSRTGSDAAADPLLPEKKKARQRLVGAIALCLLAAIVVPMLLESEPRTGLRSLPMTVETLPKPPGPTVRGSRHRKPATP